jgi:hypothetical protein
MNASCGELPQPEKVPSMESEAPGSVVNALVSDWTDSLLKASRGESSEDCATVVATTPSLQHLVLLIPCRFDTLLIKQALAG